MCVCVRACVRACVCLNRITGKLYAVVHSDAKIDDLQNYVRTMGSHSMRKCFLTFRTLYFMLDFVMGSDSVYIFGHAYGLPYATLLLRLRINVCDAIYQSDCTH